MEQFEEKKIEVANPQNQEEAGEEEGECYASVEEYFLDCCRYG